MKKKIHKILGVGLTLVMAVSLIAAFVAPVAASPDEEAWSKFDYPVTGALGDWFMDTTTDGLGPIAKAIDGTLYLYVNNTAADDVDLYKSTDEGRTWEATGYDADLAAFTPIIPVGERPIVDIACSSEDADILYVAAALHVFKSDDAGEADSWSEVDAVGMTVTAPKAITSIAVGYVDGDVPYVYIGTEDITAATYAGDVYYMSDVAFGISWTALLIDDLSALGALQGVNVYTVNCSPFFDDDTEVDVLVTTNTYGAADNLPRTAVLRNIGGTVGVWAEVAELQQDDAISFESIAASDISYVEDFDEEYEMFVGVTEVASAGDGDVYRIEEVLALDLDIGGAGTGTDVASLDVVGDFGATSLVAGATVTSVAAAVTGPADIFYSTDDGDSWDAADKAPTGLTAANTGDTVSNLVIVDDDFADNGMAWCASEVTAGGQEGGVHITTDFGATWNGISMIDTDMGAGVNDIAFTADYGTGDAPAFMVTRITGDATRSVWKYDGTNWERVYECLTATYDLDLVEVSPGYADDEALFIADALTAIAILYSHDGGATFTEMSRQPGTATTPAAITSWVVIDDETIITGAAAGGIWKTTRYGRRAWEDYSITAAGDITDLAISPDFANDHTVLAGDNASLVFISTDDGEEWDEVSASDLAALATAAGNTYVAFDPGYADNNTFYAASDDAIGRCVIDPDEDWGDQVIDDMGALAGFAAAGDMVVSADGTLYVADATAVAVEAVEEVLAVSADQFTIVGQVTGVPGSSGDITVTAGSVVCGGTSTGTIPAVTITPANSPQAWTIVNAGETITVTANAANSKGVWTLATAAGTAIAGISVDDDGDASVAAAGGAFSLPDIAAGPTPAAAGLTGGINRSLNPTDGLTDIVFELPVTGFATGETLAWNLRLTYGSNILYAIDTTTPVDIWAYEDTLAAPVILTSPADGASIPDTDEATFDWVDLNADTVEFYQLELNEYADFSGPDLGATGIDDNTWSTGGDALNAGTTYYWRVTVTDPVSSRTSAEWSFTTKVAPVEAPVQVRPLPGSQDIILLPTFSWLDMPGAVSYDIEIAPTAAFTAGVIRGTSMVNAWLLDTELEYSTTYYWRVRGISAAGIPVGDWVVSIFTTMAEPVPAPPPVVIEPTPPPVVEVPAPEMITPTWIYAIIGIGAALAIVVIVLIVRTRRVP